MLSWEHRPAGVSDVEKDRWPILYLLPWCRVPFTPWMPAQEKLSLALALPNDASLWQSQSWEGCDSWRPCSERCLCLWSPANNDDNCSVLVKVMPAAGKETSNSQPLNTKKVYFSFRVLLIRQFNSDDLDTWTPSVLWFHRFLFLVSRATQERGQDMKDYVWDGFYGPNLEMAYVSFAHMLLEKN